MTERRVLIVNADDFGLSRGVNEGIIQAHEQGIVTSTSLMVRGAAAAEAASYARLRPDLSLGLHVDLGEWVFRDGEWKLLYSVVDTDDPVAVEAEIERQTERFRLLAGREPTHLDSHQHVHRDEPVRNVMIRLSRELDVPLRHMDPRIRYCGAFYGQMGDGSPIDGALTVEHMVDILKGLPPGITEMCCHPGLDDDLESVYRSERAVEVSVLCDSQVRRVIEERCIALRSFTTMGEAA